MIYWIIYCFLVILIWIELKWFSMVSFTSLTSSRRFIDYTKLKFNLFALSAAQVISAKQTFYHFSVIYCLKLSEEMIDHDSDLNLDLIFASAFGWFSPNFDASSKFYQVLCESACRGKRETWTVVSCHACSCCCYQLQLNLTDKILWSLKFALVCWIYFR